MPLKKKQQGVEASVLKRGGQEIKKTAAAKSKPKFPVRTIRIIYDDPDLTESDSCDERENSNPKRKRAVFVFTTPRPKRTRRSSSSPEGSKPEKHPYHTGVRRRYRRFAVEIRDPIKKGRVWVGTFDTHELAVQAYEEAKRHIHEKRASKTDTGSSTFSAQDAPDSNSRHSYDHDPVFNEDAPSLKDSINRTDEPDPIVSADPRNNMDVDFKGSNCNPITSVDLLNSLELGFAGFEPEPDPLILDSELYDLTDLDVCILGLEEDVTVESVLQDWNNEFSDISEILEFFD